MFARREVKEALLQVLVFKLPDKAAAVMTAAEVRMLGEQLSMATLVACKHYNTSHVHSVHWCLDCGAIKSGGPWVSPGVTSEDFLKLL